MKRDADGKGTQIRTRAKADGEAGEPRITAVEIPADLVPERMLYLVLGRVAWAEGARYEVHTEDNATPMSAVARYVAEETVDVRGTKVSAIRVEAGRSGSGKAHVYHVSGGQVIQIAPVGAPIRLVAGTAAECAADLPETDPEAAAVRKVAGDFLRGFMTADEALVTSSLDVAAVKVRWAEHKPDIGALSDEGFLGLLLQGARKTLERRGADAMKKQVEALAGILEAKVAGDTATVSFPGAGEPIELARKDGAWKVVWWAVFARGN